MNEERDTLGQKKRDQYTKSKMQYSERLTSRLYTVKLVLLMKNQIIPRAEKWCVVFLKKIELGYSDTAPQKCTAITSRKNQFVLSSIANPSTVS